MSCRLTGDDLISSYRTLTPFTVHLNKQTRIISSYNVKSRRRRRDRDTLAVTPLRNGSFKVHSPMVLIPHCSGLRYCRLAAGGAFDQQVLKPALSHTLCACTQRGVSEAWKKKNPIWLISLWWYCDKVSGDSESQR